MDGNTEIFDYFCIVFRKRQDILIAHFPNRICTSTRSKSKFHIQGVCAIGRRLLHRM